jgi:hypothetical protein
MTKYEVVKQLAESSTVEKIVYKLLSNSKNRFDAPGDLVQDVYLLLLDKDEDLICNLYNKGELGWYILRIVRNQMFSDHSPYFYTYIRFHNLSDDLDAAKTFITED